MKNFSLKEIANFSNGKLNNDKFKDIEIFGVSIDSRTINNNEIYMPIIGERFDGHQFIEDAFKKGALATFSESGKFKNEEKPIIYVEDTNKAYQDLANSYKKYLGAKIVAITGSNGKTTTKDIISSVLETKYKTEKTVGNLNNEIGVPKTILNFPADIEIGIIEMGTDGFGQIEVLSNIANPDIAIITNIGDSHLEQLKTKENIAREKLHIIDGMSDNGIFIYNNDDEILREIVNQTDIQQRKISFGERTDSDYIIEILESSNQGTVFKLNDVLYVIPLIGKHQVYNSTVAIIVGILFDVESYNIIKAINIKELTSMRSELMNLNGFDILNDSYKSNPQSLRSALETLDKLSGYTQKIAILGDMLELGEDEVKLHRQIGKDINQKQLDYLLLYGPLSKYIMEEAINNFEDDRVFHFETKEDLSEKAKELIKKNTLVLVKASRSMQLETVIEELEDLEFKSI